MVNCQFNKEKRNFLFQSYHLVSSILQDKINTENQLKIPNKSLFLFSQDNINMGQGNSKTWNLKPESRIWTQESEIWNLGLLKLRMKTENTYFTSVS